MATQFDGKKFGEVSDTFICMLFVPAPLAVNVAFTNPVLKYAVLEMYVTIGTDIVPTRGAVVGPKARDSNL